MGKDTGQISMENMTSILGITTEMSSLKIFWFVNLREEYQTPASLVVLKFCDSSKTFSIVKRKL